MGNLPSSASGDAVNHVRSNHSMAQDAAADVVSIMEQLSIDWAVFDRQFDLIAALLAERLLSSPEQLRLLQQQQFTGQDKPNADPVSTTENTSSNDANSSGGALLTSTRRPTTLGNSFNGSMECLTASPGEITASNNNTNTNNRNEAADGGFAPMPVASQGNRLTQSLPPAPPLRRPAHSRLPSLSVSPNHANATKPSQPQPPLSRSPQTHLPVSLHNSGASLNEDGPTGSFTGGAATARGGYSTRYPSAGVTAPVPPLQPSANGGWTMVSRPSSASSRGAATQLISTLQQHSSSGENVMIASMLSVPQSPDYDGLGLPAALACSHTILIASPTLRIAARDVEYIGLRRLLDALAYLATGESRGERSRAWIEARNALTNTSAGTGAAAAAAVGATAHTSSSSTTMAAVTTSGGRMPFSHQSSGTAAGGSGSLASGRQQPAPVSFVTQHFAGEPGSLGGFQNPSARFATHGLATPSSTPFGFSHTPAVPGMMAYGPTSPQQPQTTGGGYAGSHSGASTPRSHGATAAAVVNPSGSLGASMLSDYSLQPPGATRLQPGTHGQLASPVHHFHHAHPSPQQLSQSPQRVSVSSFGEQSYNNILLVSMNARSNVSLSATFSSVHGGGGGMFSSSAGLPGVFSMSRAASRSDLLQPRSNSASGHNMAFSLSPQPSSSIPQPPQGGAGDRRSTESYLRRGYFGHHPSHPPSSGAGVATVLSLTSASNNNNNTNIGTTNNASSSLSNGYGGSSTVATMGTSTGGSGHPNSSQLSQQQQQQQPPPPPPPPPGVFPAFGLWSGSGVSVQTAGEDYVYGSSPSRLASMMSGSLSLIMPSTHDPRDDRGAGLTGLPRQHIIELLCDLFAHLHLSKSDVVDLLVLVFEAILDVQEMERGAAANDNEGLGSTQDFSADRNHNNNGNNHASSANRDGTKGNGADGSRRPRPPSVQVRACVLDLVKRYLATPLGTAEHALALATRAQSSSASPLPPAITDTPSGTGHNLSVSGRQPHPPSSGRRGASPARLSRNNSLHTIDAIDAGGPGLGGMPALPAIGATYESEACEEVNAYFRERSTVLRSLRTVGGTGNAGAAAPGGGGEGAAASRTPGYPHRSSSGSTAATKASCARGQHTHSLASSSQHSGNSVGMTTSGSTQGGHSGGAALSPGAGPGMGSGRALRDLLVQKSTFVFHYAEQMVYQPGTDIVATQAATSHRLAPAPPQGGGAPSTLGARLHQYGGGGNSASNSRLTSPAATPHLSPLLSPGTTAANLQPAPLPPGTTFTTAILWPLRTRMISLRRHYLYLYDAVASTYAMMGGSWQQRLNTSDTNADGSPSSEDVGGAGDLHTPIALCDTARSHGSDFCILSSPTDVEVLAVHPSRLVPAADQMKLLRDAANLRKNFYATSGGGGGGGSASGGTSSASAGYGPYAPTSADGLPLFLGSSKEDVEVHRVRNRDRRLFLLSLPRLHSSAKANNNNNTSSSSSSSQASPVSGAGASHYGSSGTPRQQGFAQRTQDAAAAAGSTGTAASSNSGAEVLYAGFDANRIVRPSVLSLQGAGPGTSGGGHGGAPRTGAVDTSGDFYVVSGTDPEDIRVYPLRFLCNGIVHHLFFQNPVLRAQWYDRLTALVAVNETREHAQRVAEASFDCGAFLRNRIAYPVGPSAFEFIDLLGAGAFGRVLLVRHKLCGKLFAMKVVRKTGFHSMRNVLEIRRECSILQTLDCPYTMKLHTTFQTDSRIYMLLDYLSGGELLFHVQKAKERHFDEATARFYTAQLAIAIEHLRMRGIAHRDIKGDNLVLDEDGNLVLTDFGFAKKITVDEDLYPAQGNNPPGRVLGQRTSCGTRAYIAPEVLSLTSKSEGYGLEADWWSMGVVLFTLLTGFFPFLRTTDRETNDAIINGPLQYPKVPVSDAAKDLLAGLLQKNPQQRITNLAQIKAHRFFRGFDWDACEQGRMRPPTQLHRDLYERPSSDEADLSRLRRSVFAAISLNVNRRLDPLYDPNRRPRTMTDSHGQPLRPALPCVCAPPPPINKRFTKELAEEQDEMDLVEAAYGPDVVPFPMQPENDVFSRLYEQQERCGSVRDLEEALNNNLITETGISTGSQPTAHTHANDAGAEENYIPAFLPVAAQGAMPARHPGTSSANLSGFDTRSHRHTLHSSVSLSQSLSPSSSVSTSLYLEAVTNDFNEAAYDSVTDLQQQQQQHDARTAVGGGLSSSTFSRSNTRDNRA